MVWPPGQILKIVGGPDHALWVSVNDANSERSLLTVLHPGEQRFRLALDNLEWPYPAFDPSGELWVADRNMVRLVEARAPDRSARTAYRAVAGTRLPELRFDRWGGLWGTTRSVGLFRIDRPAGAMESFDARDGLTSDVTFQPFIDREGNIWIGTAGGLDMFRYANVFPVPGIPADSLNGLRMTRAADGSVYVSADLKIYRIRPGEQPHLVRPAHGAVDALCTLSDGAAWMADARGMHRLDGVGAGTMALPPGMKPDLCLGDGAGRLWVGSAQGVSWHDAQGWHRLPATANRPMFDMVRGAGGELAFNLARKAVVLVEDGRVQVIKAEALGLGNITTLADTDSGLLIAGEGGLARYRQGRFTRIGTGRLPWMSEFRGIIQTSDGMIWALNAEGLSRFSAAALAAAFDDPRATITRRLFDMADGLASGPQHVGFRSQQLAASGDGRIWMLTRSGLFELDPAKLRSNALPPPVAIESVMAGRETYVDLASLALPPGTRSLQINFAALALSMPGRVAFRYRLDGVDDAWVALSGRGTVSYTNLGPGHYQFRVMAANEDGVWNQSGATLDFDIRPNFFQTWPFWIVCALALTGLLWCLYAARLRQATAGIRQRLAERLEERERIAREIHDTLLQSVQALTWRLQATVDDLPPGAPAREQLELAISRAEEAIVEGRDRVRELRAQDTEGDLREALAEIVAKQNFCPKTLVSTTVTGTPRAFDPIVIDEIVQVAREAIFNIRRHANARQIDIDLSYLKNFSIRFADDGVGIAEEFARRQARKGHFGLAGMRERAATLRGQLSIRRLPGGGTELILTVPGQVAYKRERSHHPLRCWPWR